MREQAQQLELLRGERHRLALQPDLARGFADAQRAEHEILLALGRARGTAFGTAQQRAHAREQHHGIHGFHHVIVGAGLEADDVVEIGVARGQDQDRHFVHAAQLAADRQAILAGQQQVEQHEAWLLAREPLHGAIAALLDGHTQAVLLEVGSRELREARVVFDQQNVDVRCGHRTSHTCRVRRSRRRSVEPTRNTSIFASATRSVPAPGGVSQNEKSCATRRP